MALLDKIQRRDYVTGKGIASIVIEDLQSINICTWSDTHSVPTSGSCIQKEVRSVIVRIIVHIIYLTIPAQ